VMVYGEYIQSPQYKLAKLLADNLPKSLSTTYFTKDTICLGELTSIGVTASGGTTNYTFNWNNSSSNSFEQLVSPTSTTNYIITSSDGCSDDNIDTIKIVVLPTFTLSFLTPQIKFERVQVGGSTA